MPLVKSFADQVSKYTTKYSGTNVTTALTAVKAIMEARYEAGASVMYDVVERVRGLLDSLGVPAPLHGVYYAFAQKLASKTFSFSTATLQNYASALKTEWVTAHGADPSILDKIINIVLGAVPPY